MRDVRLMFWNLAGQIAIMTSTATNVQMYRHKIKNQGNREHGAHANKKINQSEPLNFNCNLRYNKHQEIIS
jgi:hypothetical protein